MLGKCPTARYGKVPAASTASPTVGTSFFDKGTFMTNAVVSPDTIGTTQYVCSGWSMTGNDPTNGSGTNFTMTLTNIATLTWQWRTNYYLALTTNGNGSVSPSSGYYGQNSNVAVTATPAPHWHFAGWTGDVQGDTNALTMTRTMDSPRSLTANFAIDQHTLTVTAGIGGGAEPGTLTTNYGTVVTQWVTNGMPIYGTTQYVSTGWTLSGNADTGGVYVGSATNVTLTLTNNASLVWGWTTNYYLTLSTNGNGSVSPSSGFYALGSNVQVTATPGLNNEFKSWSGDTNGCSITGTNLSISPVTGPRAITANFQEVSSGTVFKFR